MKLRYKGRDRLRVKRGVTQEEFEPEQVLEMTPGEWRDLRLGLGAKATLFEIEEYEPLAHAVLSNLTFSAGRVEGDYVTRVDGEEVISGRLGFSLLDLLEDVMVERLKDSVVEAVRQRLGLEAKDRVRITRQIRVTRV